MRWLLLYTSISRDNSAWLMAILFTKNGAQQRTSTFTYCLVLWHNSQHSGINIKNGYTCQLWLNIDTVITHHSLPLCCSSPTDTRQTPGVKSASLLRDFMHVKMYWCNSLLFFFTLILIFSCCNLSVANSGDEVIYLQYVNFLHFYYEVVAEIQILLRDDTSSMTIWPTIFWPIVSKF